MIREIAQLKGDTGTAFAEVVGLFVGVGKLEDSKVLLIAADNLEANRETFGRET